MKLSKPSLRCLGQLHNVKIKLVCNKHLADLALNLRMLELDKYIFMPVRNFKWYVGHPLPVSLPPVPGMSE